MKLDDIKCNFGNNKLHIDLDDIKLTQNVTREDAITFSGKGYIEQKNDGKITFKLYTTDKRNTNSLKFNDELSKIKSGSLYGDENYHTFVGKDYSGNEWISERIIINADWIYESDSALVYGQLDRVELKHSVFQNSGKMSKFAVLHFFEDVDLRNVLSTPEQKLENSPYKFTFKKFNGGFSIRIDSEDDLPEHIDVRILEAARFVIAHSLSPKFTFKHGSYYFNSSFDRSKSFKLGRPVSRDDIAL